MPLSDRLKGLLDWWQLRIQTNRKDNEVNDARINIDDAVCSGVCSRDRNKQEDKEIK
jgi:hypothetical protein